MAKFVFVNVSHVVFTRAPLLACQLVRCYLGLYVLPCFDCVQHVHVRSIFRGRFNTPVLEARAT